MSLHKTLYFASNELERILIEIDIKRFDNEFDKREFMVDTGADRSAMSTTALSLCGYDLNWINTNKIPHRAATADNKMLDAYIIRIPEIHIGGFKAIEWPFLVLLKEDGTVYDKGGFQNIFGRDLLAGFNYSCDNETKKFVLEPVSKYKNTFPFLPGQQYISPSRIVWKEGV